MSADLLAADDPGWLLDRLVGATVLSNFRPDPPPPGPGRNQPRRPDVEGKPAPAAGPLLALPPRPTSWPARPTCSVLISRPAGPGLVADAASPCVLPPGHDGTTHLPKPRSGRR